MSTERALTGHPLRVLLIEDDENDALLLERHLRRSGFMPDIVRVETAAQMGDALEDHGERWDVILADFTLPEFSAPEALKLLKSTQYDIPFIMMSGAVSEETAVTAMRAGAHDYISKQNLTRLVPAIERERAEARQRHTRRATERALKVSEERFHRLVEGMPLALLICDAQGHILYVNEGIERLLGYTPRQVLSGEVLVGDIMPAAGSEPAAMLASWSQGRRQNHEVLCRRCDGQEVPVLIGASMLNPEAAPRDRQIAAFMADLTDQKRSQDVLRRTEKLAAAGRLAASIAHEINNPLEAVTNCMYLLQQLSLDDLARTYVNLAQQELNRVTHITTQTLRFYRQSTRPVKTDVHELFETVLALFEVRLRSHHVKVERQFHALPAIIAYDGEIRQVLANLVGNALDAVHFEGGRIILRTHRSRHWQKGTEGIAIVVADNGSGIPSAARERIFEPFFSTKGITGTGLGLWVSREILTKHAGEMRVRSRTGPRAGTTFRIFLPLGSDSMREPGGAPSADEAQRAALPSLTGA